MSETREKVKNPLIPLEADRGLALKLQVTMFLEKDGWSCSVVPGEHRGKSCDTFVAYKKGYPVQRAVDPMELIRRCLWEERHRTPKIEA